MAAKRAPSSRLRCPECGFKAAHPMGLGRHRSSKHGILSSRERQRRALRHSNGLGVAATRQITALRHRVVDLERQQEKILSALRKAVR